MKNNKLTIAMMAIFFVFGLMQSKTTLAATDPGLGAAATFSVLAQTAVTNVPTSSIAGDVGLNSAGTNYSGLTSAEVVGTIYDTNGTGPDGASAILSAAVQANASTAYTNNIPGQSATSSIGPALDGLTVTTGVYDIGAGRLNGGILTLDGPGIYIFRASSDFISSGSISLINGARACDVYWRVETLATINGSSFVGTILAGTGVHFGANVSLNGRALAIGGDVTLISNTISSPTCASTSTPATPAGTQSLEGTITVIKNVINDNGRTKKVNDFKLFLNDQPITSGIINNVVANYTKYKVTETKDPNYTTVFSGNCNINGEMTLAPIDDQVCVITNNDIGAPVVVPPVPPLIDIVKVPSPLSIQVGPGDVTYTYTLRNIGTVPVTDITLVGDTCSPIVLISGDNNNNKKLETTETWIHTCKTTLSATHKNTVVATGWANGLSAVDIASATVVVNQPIIPPLIHVTKVPNPLSLSSKGGMVTYTETITNPGLVALSNVKLTDDKCNPVAYVSGDTNNDKKLDTTESWKYTCRTSLSQTTTNTATASGEANGFIVTDHAIVTVTVSAVPPTMPSTGFQNIPWSALLFSIAMLTLIASIIVLQKRIN